VQYDKVICWQPAISRLQHALWFSSRLWRYINYLLTYLKATPPSLSSLLVRKPLRLPSWYYSVWPATHLLIWPTTVSSPLMPMRSLTPFSRHGEVRRPSYVQLRDRCFAAARPRLWNTLPLHLRLCDSLGQFKRSLKTFLFGLRDHGALWH